MSFFEKIGKFALGSRLRILSERMMEDAAQIYPMYGLDMRPKWFPVFYVLSQQKQMGIMAIADEIGQTHPSVIKTVREMVKAGIAGEKSDPTDGRRNLIFLTERGEKMNQTIQEQYVDIDIAVEQMLTDTQHDIWRAVGEFEYLLDQKSLLHRVREQKKIREAQFVKIIDYTPDYQKAFYELNRAWITHYFKMEEADRKALDNPQSYILDPGGYIAVACYQEEPVGVCALIKMDDPDYDYELAKMAVSPQAQGKGIGYLLGRKMLEKAHELGATKVYLESNSRLTPALTLYRKLGFQKVTGRPTPYERADIQMDIDLTKLGFS
ncbi:MAG: bifunctional helix-turn-helix transcriptional regulator/GNAT family N-acetyltransferase [Bacteroidota bacterium]